MLDFETNLYGFIKNKLLTKRDSCSIVVVINMRLRNSMHYKGFSEKELSSRVPQGKLTRPKCTNNSRRIERIREVITLQGGVLS